MSKNQNIQNSENQNNSFYFGKENYKWMLIGLALIIVGFLLMLGADANTVDGKLDPNSCLLYTSRCV